MGDTDVCSDGYEDSLYDCSEYDGLRPAAAEVTRNVVNIPMRKSKLTKAERKKAALWLQEVNATIDAQDAAVSVPCSLVGLEARHGGEDWE